jgi:undecaprenyl-diphosphatase
VLFDHVALPSANNPRLTVVSADQRDEQFVLHPPRAVRLGAAFLVLFALFAVFVPGHPLAFEQSWADWMREIQTPVLEHIALVFNYLGRGLGRALTLVAIGVPLIATRRWWALLAYSVTEALTPLTSSIVKALVDRSRPPDGLVSPSSSSFPSGHAAFAGATFVSLVLLFTKVGPRRRIWWSLAAVGIAGMAWSRTYLQVHWLLDVIAGSLLGSGITLIVFAGLQLILRARRRSGAEGG